jgi:hypothetical protein
MEMKAVQRMTTIENDYYHWLTSQIKVPANTQNRYDDLFQRLHDTEFVWIISNDDNRLQDGEDLRGEFLNGSRRRTFPQPVSLLEVLIALSRRLAFSSMREKDPGIWVWRLIKNLRLNKASDPLVGQKADYVEDVLEGLIWRTYAYNGRGGLFPLKEPKEDQTRTEIWNQMNAYLIETEKL